MGADAWRVCPRCLAASVAKKQKALEKAGKLYGKVSASEYMAAVKAAESISSTKVDQTFRENYEIYTLEDGEFNIRYYGNCTVCDFSHKFELTQNLLED